MSGLLRRQVDARTRALQAELTTRKEVERQLSLAKEKAEAGSRAKSEFLATMSHEIRTPLNGVLATANLLHETALDSEQKEYVDIIGLSGQALLAVIDDILDFSKIEAGEIETVSQPFAPRQLVEETIRILATRAAERETHIHQSVDEEVPHKVLGDADRLRQVLLNLMGNAVKFTPGGDVHLTLNRVSEHPTILRFEVRDTGIGIPEEKRHQLFKPFSQLDSAFTRKYGGTGLGLAITKRLVEIMGGEIGVESTEGEGSTFFFTIQTEPFTAVSASSETQGETPPAEKESLDFSGMKILVAEDNAVNQKIIARILGKFGAEVDLADNGLKALQAAEKNDYDLVFMDLQMPEMDGLEAAGHIIETCPVHRRPRIVACTANATDEDKARCLEAGMDGFLVKPLNTEKVAATLARWRPVRPVGS
jgi:CheY-like chemotaxis protein/nitrogen-specific signal transduction histidine kinase